MEREPENDERIQEVDRESRKKSGDQQDATPEQLGASGTGGSSKTSGAGGSGTGGSSKTPGGGASGTSGRTGTPGGTGTGNRDTGSPGTGPRPSEAQGDERQRMGNKNPDTGTGHKS